MGIQKVQKNVQKKEEQALIRDSRINEAYSGIATSEFIKRENAVLIKYEELSPCQYNRDASHNIDDLAENIYQNGILSSLRVTGKKINGKHVIIAGERRWRAIGKLREQYPDDERFWYIPCELSNAEKDIDIVSELVGDNLDRENPTVEDFRKIIENINTMYDAMLLNGDNISEKREAFVKSMLAKGKLSDRQLRRYTTIVNKAIPSVQTMTDNGMFTLKQAEAISTLDEGTQEFIVSLRSEGYDTNDENIKRIKELSSTNASLLNEISIKNNRIAILEQSVFEKDNQKTQKEIAKLKKEKAAIGKKLVEKLGTDHFAIKKTLDTIDLKLNSIRKNKKVILTEVEKQRLENIIKKINTILDDKKEAP